MGNIEDSRAYNIFHGYGNTTIYKTSLYAVKPGYASPRNMKDFNKRRKTIIELGEVYVKKINGHYMEIIPSGEKVSLINKRWYPNGNIFIPCSLTPKNDFDLEKASAEEVEELLNKDKELKNSNGNKTVREILNGKDDLSSAISNLSNENLMKYYNEKYNNKDFNRRVHSYASGYKQGKCEKQKEINVSLYQRGKITREELENRNNKIDIILGDITSYKKGIDPVKRYEDLISVNVEKKESEEKEKNEEYSVVNEQSKKEKNLDVQNQPKVEENYTTQEQQKIEETPIVQNQPKVEENIKKQETKKETSNEVKKTSTTNLNNKIIPVIENDKIKTNKDGKQIYEMRTSDYNDLFEVINNSKDKIINVTYNDLLISSEDFNNVREVVEYITAIKAGQTPKNEHVKQLVSKYYNEQKNEDQKSR